MWYTGLYAQDEWQVDQHLKLTAGPAPRRAVLRGHGLPNAEADALTFRDQDGNPVQYQTEQLPESNLLWSPRVGFNWDVDGGRSTQLRGGTGVFTGRPAYVWISNQIAEHRRADGLRAARQHAGRGRSTRTPTPTSRLTVTGAPASSYELALTDPSFKFPQVWRSNLAVDREPAVGNDRYARGLYTRDVNGISYINANLPAAQARLSGADDRPRWTANRIHANVRARSCWRTRMRATRWNVAASLSKTLRRRLPEGRLRLRPVEEHGRARFARRHSWSTSQHAGDPNNPGVQRFAHGHRAFLAGSHRFEYLKVGATTLSFFLEGRNAGNASYTYAGDLNGDGGTANDLIYVPRDESEMNFQTSPRGAARSRRRSRRRRGTPTSRRTATWQAPRGVRRAQRSPAADGMAARLQRRPGALREPGRAPPRAPAACRLPEPHQPARRRLGRRASGSSVPSRSRTPASTPRAGPPTGCGSSTASS